MHPSTLCFGNNSWTLSCVRLNVKEDHPPYGLGQTFIVHFMYLIKFSSFLDEPSTLWTQQNFHPPWVIRLFYRLNKILILHGWTVHSMDLIRFSSVKDEPSTLWTQQNFHPLWMIHPFCGLNKILILRGWTIHSMDLIRFSSIMDEPSTLWTQQNFHPLWMIRPFYGLNKISPFMDGLSTLWT